jgi:uncharacterized OB-fold protein
MDEPHWCGECGELVPPKESTCDACGLCEQVEMVLRVR